MKQWVVNLIASLIVGLLVSGFFWIMVWLANKTGIDLWVLIFSVTSVMTLYVANQN